MGGWLCGGEYWGHTTYISGGIGIGQDTMAGGQRENEQVIMIEEIKYGDPA